MINVKFGNYGFYHNMYYELHNKKNSCELIYKGCLSLEQEKIGFKKYAERVYIFEVKCDIIIFAFQVKTFCTYKGFKFLLENIFNNKFIILPCEEAQRHFKNPQKHGYDPVYEVEENEIDEIWEERKPIEGFKFNVEPILYLKEAPPSVERRD